MDNITIEKIMQETRKLFISESQLKIENNYKTFYNYCLDANEESRLELENLFHAIKGSAAVTGYNEISSIGKKYEDLMISYKGQLMLSEQAKVQILKGMSEILARIYMLSPNPVQTTPVSDNTLIPYEQTISSSASFAHSDYTCYQTGTCKGNILIVDDDIVILEYLEKNLKNAGYTPYITSRPEEVQFIAISKNIDLILIDVMLPQKSGFEVFENIKQLKFDGGVIFLTSKAMETDKLNGLNLGADDYITKPFNIEELLARIERIIKSKINTKTKVNKDEVSNAFTRNHFYDSFKTAMKNLEHNNSVFTLVMIDIENFKRINRDYGYFIGDLVLRKFVEELNNNLNGEKIFRLESDIFAVIFEHLDSSRIYSKLDEIHSKISSNNFPPLKSQLNFSSIIYHIKSPNDKLENLLNIMYDGLEKSKYSGKERVSFIAKDTEFYRKIRILVIEDESVTVFLIKKHLEVYGYEIFYANDGFDALEKLKKITPDIILLDLMLPKLNGFDLCKIIKEDVALKNTRIIVISAKTDPIDIQQCYDLGVDDFVQKPFSFEDLERRVTRLLQLNPAVIQT